MGVAFPPGCGHETGGSFSGREALQLTPETARGSRRSPGATSLVTQIFRPKPGAPQGRLVPPQGLVSLLGLQPQVQGAPRIPPGALNLAPRPLGACSSRFAPPLDPEATQVRLKLVTVALGGDWAHLSQGSP